MCIEHFYLIMTWTIISLTNYQNSRDTLCIYCTYIHTYMHHASYTPLELVIFVASTYTCTHTHGQDWQASHSWWIVRSQLFSICSIPILCQGTEVTELRNIIPNCLLLSKIQSCLASVLSTTPVQRSKEWCICHYFTGGWMISLSL